MSLKYLGDSIAYQPLTCAEHWFDEEKKHTVPAGSTIVSFGTYTKEGEPRTLYYCQTCGIIKKQQCEEIQKSLQSLPL